MKNTSLFAYGTFENVKLSMEELGKLNDKFGKDGATERIDDLSVYLAAKGKRYKSHYATLLMWDRMKKTAAPKKAVDKSALQYDRDELREWSAKVEREAAEDLKRMREKA